MGRRTLLQHSLYVVPRPSEPGWVNWEALGEIFLISSEFTLGRRLRTILLAGLVSITLIGSTGVAFAEDDPTTPPSESSTTSSAEAPPAPAPVEAQPPENNKPADPQEPPKEEPPKEDPPKDPPKDPVLIAPEVNSGSGCDNDAGFVVVSIKNPNDVKVEYTVELTREADPGKPVQTKKQEVGAGATKEVGFDDVASGLFTVRVKSGPGQDVLNGVEVDRCKEIGPIDDPLQVFVRCQDGKGLVTIRVFNLEGDSRTFTVSIDDLKLPGEIELGKDEFAVVVDEATAEDGTYVVRVEAEGIDHKETVKVACAPVTTPPAPTTTTPPAPQGGVAANTGSGGLASTGAAVGGLALLGLLAFGLGGGLLIASRRRRTRRTEA